MCVDGAPDPDAEPDERAADGYADCLVQRVSEILWHFFNNSHSGTHCRVSFVCNRSKRSAQRCFVSDEIHPGMTCFQHT